MKGNDVDEDSEPVSVVRHYSSRRAWQAFNTHYLRAGRPKSQSVHFEAYDLSYTERMLAALSTLPLFDLMYSLFARLKPREKGLLGSSIPDLTPSQGGGVGDAASQPSLGVESDSTTLKSGERLNTVPTGGRSTLRSTLTLAEMRERREARKAKAATEEIPF